MSDNNKKHEENSAKILAESLEKAFLQSCDTLGCDLKCFDWLNYNPDFHFSQQVKKAA